MYDDEQPAHVSVAQRQAQAEKAVSKLRQQGYSPQPITPFRTAKIAKSFWGHSWCRHLESYSDYESRLPRGRSYVRNGSVCHLDITSSKANAFVCGSELYEIQITIDPLPQTKWADLKKQCSGKIGTLIDLLQGKLSDEVMTIVTDKETGLFPTPSEIHLNCNCLDHADLCKHLAAVLYGIGNRLDTHPELLFLLRGLDHTELLESDLTKSLDTPSSSNRRRIATNDLSNVFGIDIASDDTPIDLPTPQKPTPSQKRTATKTPKKTAKKAVAPKAKPIPSPTTGNDIKKLRRKFAMSEYEFGLIIDLSAVTISDWESKGKAPHDAQAKNQTALNELAPLTPDQAKTRLNEYR